MSESEPSGEVWPPVETPQAVVPAVVVVPAEEPTDPKTQGVPAVLRTVIYLLGALGTVILFVDDGNISNSIILGAKVAAGLAAITGFTYNPSFGVGARKK